MRSGTSAAVMGKGCLRSEIERLQADNKQLENEIADMALGPTMVQNQRAEIERLRTTDELREVAFQCYIDEQKKDRAEIERLTEMQMRKDAEAREQIQAKDAEIKRLTRERDEAHDPQVADTIAKVCDRIEINDLRFEVERLRAEPALSQHAEVERLRTIGLELLAIIERLPSAQHSLARALIDKVRAALSNPQQDP